MKRILYHTIVCCAALSLLAACSKENDLPGNSGTECNDIILDLSPTSQPLSRATAEGAEVAVDHLDVVIFKEADGTLAWHERVSGCADREGKITLSAQRSRFDAQAPYWVYLIANSTHTADEFAALPDLNALRAMTQEDRLIHMTGLANVGTAPKTFLMDGVAYPAAEAAEPSAAPVVLYNGNPSDNTELKVMLRRAAAKIVVRINKGSDVRFDNSLSGTQAGYYLRNLPYSTSLIAGVDGAAYLRNTQLNSSSYFQWNADQIAVTAYAYAHEWANASSLEQEVRLVVNIPMVYTNPEDQTETECPNSYYQIPVSRTKRLERNNYYEVTVTVNAPGATDPAAPAELTDISYTVRPWEETTIDIGGEDSRPIYLTVNKKEMEMHNIEEDNTTLYFASSSAVECRIARVYYTDKFGQTQQTTNAGSIAGMGITATPDPGLNGNIDIYSPLPTNNTIRYIDLEVTNEDGVTRTVTIAQYPLEYITNILGWYSYRDDFGGTTYELLAGQNVDGKTFDSDSRISNWICGCTWSRNQWSYGKTETGFFGSKVAGTVATSGTNAGKAHIYYYRWTENEERENIGSGWWPTYVYRYTYNVSNGSDVWSAYANPRMYHVRITASSGEYTLGVPRITDGKTDPGADNAELVSPSFMIASQLGAVQSVSNVDIAASHCEQYVEVYKDENGQTVHLRDWRLPTRAELEIIMKFQNDSEAMDEVLAGQSYWCANGLVTNPDPSQTSSQAIRCIRDAYTNQTGD